MQEFHKYNFSFYPNACHICKKFGPKISLKRCGKCKMISYCSKEHQREHWLQHKELCHAIFNILENKRLMNLLKKNEEQNTGIEKLAQMKLNFMAMVALQIKRKLLPYEEDMFKFLRSCCVCHNQNVTVLQDCPNCPNISFCTEHKAQGLRHKFCHLIKVCYNLDVLQITSNHNMPTTKVPYRTNYISLPKDMQNFIDCYIVQKTREEDAMVNSELLTRPLTFLYAIQKLACFIDSSTITIHIVAANWMDLLCMSFWDILLHWLLNIRRINIFVIGPELSSELIPLDLCDNCKTSGKQISVQIVGLHYDAYIQSNSYIKPNFVIGYNAGIHEFEEPNAGDGTWIQSVREIAKQNCPFILTSYTLWKAMKERAALNKILDHELKYTCFAKNPYSSMRPYRDFETNGIYYQNNYVIIYKDLKAPS